jgi:hypothetical protein
MSGAERNVSTFRGLFPFLSLSLSFSLSLIVGFRPKTCVCPAMMYKTKSCRKHRKHTQRRTEEGNKERKREGSLLSSEGHGYDKGTSWRS